MSAIGRLHFFALFVFIIASAKGDLGCIGWYSFTLLGHFWWPLLLLHNRTYSEQIPTTGAPGGRGHHADIHGVPVSQVMAVLVLCRVCRHWRSHLSIGAVDAPATDYLDCSPLRNEQRRGDCYRGKYAIFPLCPGIPMRLSIFFFLYLFFASPVTRSKENCYTCFELWARYSISNMVICCVNNRTNGVKCPSSPSSRNITADPWILCSVLSS